jgi:hypothetical protein
LITASLSPDIPPGRLSAPFTLMNTCKRVRKFRLYIGGEVKAPYELSHRVLVTRPSAQGRPLASLTVSGDKPLKITNLSVTGDAFEAALRAGETANAVVIEVTALKPIDKDAAPEIVSFDVECAGTTYTNKVEVSRMRLR